VPEIDACKHYWRVLGKSGSRWFDEHAVMKCVHCKARTVGEYGPGGVGPCSHSVGQHVGRPHEAAPEGDDREHGTYAD
jgi:hypothetical protein